MKKTTDLNPERSEKYKYLDKLNYVPKFIIISACCVFLTAVCLLVSVLSLYNSTNANAKVDYELQATRAEVTVMKNTVELQIVYLQELYFLLKEHEIEPPPLPEK